MGGREGGLEDITEGEEEPGQAKTDYKKPSAGVGCSNI